MNAEQAKQLRAPFPESMIGKLPKPTKKDNPKGTCRECGGYHGLPAVHLDFVGHAPVTDRFLQVDPDWTWEPMARGPNGEPLITDGGLWIWLTICGVTRPGFGDATGGKGPKEMIGDALRNAGMRFGVGLDLWAKEDLHAVPEVDPFEALETELYALTEKAGQDVGKVRAAVEEHREKSTREGHKVWLTRCIEAAEAKGSAATGAADTSGDTEPQAGADESATSPVSAAEEAGRASTPVTDGQGAAAASGGQADPRPSFQAPSSVPVQKPASAAQKKALNALIGRVREQANRVTTAELWAFVGRTPDTPEDGEHFAPLRESLTLHEASSLIEHLKTLEEFAIADGALEPRRAA